MSDQAVRPARPADRSGPPAPEATGRTRLLAAVAALVTIGAGLGLRAVATGDVAKYGGDALYTLLILTLVVLLAPRSTPARAAGIALAVSWAVELLQLTGLPAGLSARSTAARLVLGSTFNAPDLFWYAVGACAGWLALRAVARRREAG
ncbi:ribosomal maturation YjgA family protein [Streptomyces griseoincarnatus]